MGTGVTVVGYCLNNSCVFKLIMKVEHVQFLNFFFFIYYSGVIFLGNPVCLVFGQKTLLLTKC